MRKKNIDFTSQFLKLRFLVNQKPREEDLLMLLGLEDFLYLKLMDKTFNGAIIIF